MLGETHRGLDAAEAATQEVGVDGGRRRTTSLGGVVDAGRPWAYGSVEEVRRGLRRCSGGYGDLNSTGGGEIAAAETLTGGGSRVRFRRHAG